MCNPAANRRRDLSSRTFVWLFILVAGGFTGVGHADEPPRLPDQYAEAVLQVEGMI
jgi:hypothetical protein